MKLLALVAAALVAATSFVVTVREPAHANAFCPITIAAVTDLAILGRAGTYGVMLDLDPSDATSVRLRVDSNTTRYAIDINDLAAGPTPVEVRRYFTLAPGEQIATAWVESTGIGADSRLECPITRPYSATAPAPIDPRVVRERTTAQTSLRDSFSTKTLVLNATSFGPAQAPSCAQPFVPPHAAQDMKPAPPPGARAVHANGTTIVRVDLDETSALVEAQVLRSSGYAPLDAAALKAAQSASYRTETFDCRPVASSYQFAVSFTGN